MDIAAHTDGGFMSPRPSAAPASDRTVRPAFRRRREIGAASARSLLLTVLGEFALPWGRPVWTSAFLHVLSLLEVEEKATRQALARTAAEGWLQTERSGRRTAWALTPAGRRLLTEGAARIYGFGTVTAPWDGSWLLVLASVPESDRKQRHLLRTRLAWAGLGNLRPGMWVSAHVEREAEVRDELDRLGLAEPATFFHASLGADDDARRVAREAWDLDDIAERYEDFLDAVRGLRPRGRAATLAAQVRLVQEWRRFPFLDPGLPAALLPRGWVGTKAGAVFRDRHGRWKPEADQAWRSYADAE